MAKFDIQEIKTYKCSDGSIYDSKDAAEAHEIELKDPNYAVEKRLGELERKFLELQGELLKLSARVERLESPWGKLNPIKDVKPNSPFDQKVWYGVGQNLTEALNNLKEVSDDDR